MADFVWTESPGTSLTLEAKVVASQFGDGYVQRAPDGLNYLRQNWDYVAEDIDDAIADQIEAFLKPKLALVPFDYVPLRQTTALRFVCTSYTRTAGRVGESSIRARFEQDFAP